MKRDELIFDIIEKEHQRQLKGIELIASENFVSDQVMEAMGSCLTNKYAEGYPGKRYYGGCEVVDQSEQIAIDRLKELFGAEWANVQPHSGAQANMAVFFAMLQPGDKVLGMNLDHGGHLSHGSPVNMSGKYFDVAFYGNRYEQEKQKEETAEQWQERLTNQDANKTFNIDVSVEAIQEANNAARAVWTTAPEEWLDTYNPVVSEG